MNRVLGVLAGLVVVALAGCSSEPVVCTAIGARPGVGLEIAEPLALEVTDAKMQVCWEGECSDLEIELFPSSTSEPQECTGTGPDDSCSAKGVTTGEKNGFGDLSELPESEVDVTVTLVTASGEQVFQDSVLVTPERIYPNGPQCGGDAPQISLVAQGSELRVAP